MDEKIDQCTTDYPSMVAEGYTVVELPKMDNLGGDEGGYNHSDMRGVGGTEKFLARNFGRHVEAQIEHAFKYQGPTAACAYLSHYAEHGKNSLLDEKSAKEMRDLSRSMARSNQPEKFFQTEVTPFLRALTSQSR
jgi:hypothetical protein